MSELKKKIVLPVEADPSKANSKIDNLKKDAEKKGIDIPVNVDLKGVTDSLSKISNLVENINKAFGKLDKDGKNFKFSGMQKSLDDILVRLKSVIGITTQGDRKVGMFRVDVRGLSQLTELTNTINKNIETLNETKIDTSSLNKLEEVLENIETILNSIKTGLNFETIRPSTMVQNDIEKTTEKLEALAKQEEKIAKLEKYLNNSGVKKGKAILDFGTSEEIDAIDNLVNKMKEYISLGGDLSKIQFKYKGIEDTISQMYSLADVFEILDDEGRIELIDESKITNDVETVKALRTELSNLNEELVNAKLRENRDLNVSLDTKSVEEFSQAISTALEKIGEINFSIPEGFTFEGLSTENLDKIIVKLDEIVSSITNLATLLSTGVDFSKINENIDDKFKENKHDIKIGVAPDVNVDEFISEIETAIKQSNKKVKVETVADQGNLDNDQDGGLINDKVIKEDVEAIRGYFQDLTNDFGDNLSDAISDFKESLEVTTGQIDYDAMFTSLRQSLLDIVTQFQNSLQAVGLSSTQLDEAYQTIKGWNDASKIIVNTGGQDSERAAFFNKGSGKVSNGYLYDKNGEFSNQILDELNRLESGVSGKIGEVYDTWLHTHPFKKTLEGLKTIGSDVGFSPSDLSVYKNKFLKSDIDNMMVSSNGKYTNINWNGISEAIIDEVIKLFKSSDIFENDKFIGKLATEKNGIYNFDKQTKLINDALIKAMSDAGIENAESRISTGNIEDLKVDMSVFKQEEQEAADKAEELLNILTRISDALTILNQSDVFKFEGVDSLMIQLENAKSLMTEICNSFNDNFKVDSTNVLVDLFKEDDAKAIATNWVNALSNAINIALDESSPFDLLKHAANEVFDKTQELQREMDDFIQKSPVEISININSDDFDWKYEEVKKKIDELNKDVIVNVQGLLGDLTFGVPISGQNDKAQRDLDIQDLDYILNLVKQREEFFDKFYQYGDKLFNNSSFQQDMDDLGISIDKLVEALKNTGFADKDLKPTFSIPSDGMMHTVGAVGEKYVLLGRDSDQPVGLKDAKIKKQKVDELVDIGCNIARIVMLKAKDSAYDQTQLSLYDSDSGSIHSSDTKNYFEVQERKQGINHRKASDIVLGMSKEQLVQFLRDAKLILNKGLAFETGGDNFLANKTDGLIPIDIATQNEHWMSMATTLEELVSYLKNEFYDSDFRNRLDEAYIQVDNEKTIIPNNQEKRGVDIGVNPLMDDFIDNIQAKINTESPVTVKVDPKIDSDDFLYKLQNEINKSQKPEDFIDPMTGEVFKSQQEFLKNYSNFKDFKFLDADQYKTKIREIRREINDALTFDNIGEQNEDIIRNIVDNINQILNDIPELQNFFPKIENSLPDNSFFNEYYDLYTDLRHNANSYDINYGEFIQRYVNQLKQGFEQLGNIQEAPKVKVEPLIDKSEFANQVTEQVKGVETTSGNAIQYETTNVELLHQKLVDVTTAIDAKTRAFQEEEQIVSSAVQREITELEALDGQLYLILQSLEKIQKLPITLDVNLPEDFYNEDSKISGIINELKQSLDGINLEALNNLSSMIQNLSVKDEVVINIQKLANAILNLKSNLNNLSLGGSQFLNDLKELTVQADALKDISTIIKASKEEIQKAKEVVATPNLESDLSSISQENENSASKLNQEIENITISTKEASAALDEYKEKWKILSQVGDATDDSFSLTYEKNKGQIEAVKWWARKDKNGNYIYDDDGNKEYEISSTTISNYQKLEKTVIDADNALRKLKDNKKKILELDENASTTFIDTQIENQKQYIKLLEQTIEYISNVKSEVTKKDGTIEYKNAYEIDTQVIREARDKAKREYELSVGAKGEMSDAKKAAFDDQKRLKNIERVNRVLNKQQIIIDSIEQTYDKSRNKDLDRAVSKESDLKELSSKKSEIQTLILQLKNQERNTSNEAEFLRLEKLISEYKELAKYKLKANNPSKQELGGQDLKVLLEQQIAAYDKLIIKAEKYGDETKETVKNLKTQRDIIAAKNKNGNLTATADDYYNARDNLKIESASFSVFEQEAKSFEKFNKELQTLLYKEVKNELIDIINIRKELRTLESGSVEKEELRCKLLETEYNYSKKIAEIKDLGLQDAEKDDDLARLEKNSKRKDFVYGAQQNQKDIQKLEKIDSTIQKASFDLKKLQNLSSSSLFAEEFKKAEIALEGFNSELNKDGNITEYNKKVKNLISDLKDMQNVIEVIEPNNIDLAKEKTQAYAFNQSSKAKLIDTNTKKNITTLTYAWDEQNGALRKLVFTYDEATGKLKQIGNAQKEAKESSFSFLKFWKHGWANLVRYLTTFVGFYEIWAQIRQGITVIRELDTALTEMRKVSDESVSSLKEFQKVSFDIAGSVGTTAKQIQNSTADWMGEILVPLYGNI